MTRSVRPSAVHPADGVLFNTDTRKIQAPISERFSKDDLFDGSGELEHRAANRPELRPDLAAEWRGWNGRLRLELRRWRYRDQSVLGERRRTGHG